MNQPTDPRPLHAAATAWTAALIAGVRTEQRDLPTPCENLDVHELCAHLVGVARRTLAVPERADVQSVDPFPELTETDRVGDLYADTTARAVHAWAADDGLLTETVRVPWGEVPGARALWGYLNETLVHGWDLAVATGQPAEADPALAEAALAVAQQFIPAEIREMPDIPFGPVVTPRAEAGATERLANWSGRESRRWVGADAH